MTLHLLANITTLAIAASAIASIAHMARTQGVKMIAALRMEHRP